MNDENNQQPSTPSESLGTVEYAPQVVESTNDHHYSNDTTPVVQKNKEQVALSVTGLILALPFPILIIILWVTLAGIKGEPQGLAEGAMNAVFIYLLQFFIVPVTSIASVVIGFIVTMKSQAIAKKIGYISFAVTGVGFVVLGLFLNNT